MKDTRANLQGCRVALLRELGHVDTATDYLEWRRAGQSDGLSVTSRLGEPQGPKDGRNCAVENPQLCLAKQSQSKAVKLFCRTSG